MRKRIAISMAVVVAIAIVFGAGVEVQRQYQIATIRAAGEFARDLAGLNDPVPTPPLWESWSYPGAELKGHTKGSSVRVNGQLVRPPGQYAIFITADPFESVARFYAEKAEFQEPNVAAMSNSAVSSTGNIQGESNHLLDDFHEASDPQTLRPVRVKCLIRRSPSYDLSVVITRANEEKFTHMALFYDPHIEPEEAAR